MSKHTAPRPIALVDMDGTLVDYDKAMMRDMKALMCPHEVIPDDWYKAEDQPWLKTRMDLIKGKPGWWLNLDMFQLGWNVMGYLKEAGFKIHVLTRGPIKHPQAWAEKVEWCRKHLPGTQITLTEDKGIVYGKVLVDDWPPYIKKWLAHRPRGLVIMPAQKWNTDFTHPQVIRYDGVTGSEVAVEARIKAVLEDKTDD